VFSSTNVTASPHPQATPAVHILMPVYNALDYIYEAIESVFSQSYQNLKLIIFDDGSTDKLLPLVQKFKKNHPQIGGRLWLTRVDKNRGTAYARTRLIQLSKCLNSFAYIGWLDADDKFADNDFV
jgi:glycosyltransferase involved in cell wall biosynthesis